MVSMIWYIQMLIYNVAYLKYVISIKNIFKKQTKNFFGWFKSLTFTKSSLFYISFRAQVNKKSISVKYNEIHLYNLIIKQLIHLATNSISKNKRTILRSINLVFYKNY